MMIHNFFTALTFSVIGMQTCLASNQRGNTERPSVLLTIPMQHFLGSGGSSAHEEQEMQDRNVVQIRIFRPLQVNTTEMQGELDDTLLASIGAMLRLVLPHSEIIVHNRMHRLGSLARETNVLNMSRRLQRERNRKDFMKMLNVLLCHPPVRSWIS
ncbi:MAG: hypothetical protein LBQ43_01930 [Holosporales bacterium]|jgi:hypothetical protein|nr:hypothetical protein [Holosporales bacterium]